MNNTNGNADTIWNPNANNSVQTIAVSGSDIYVGGQFVTVGGNPQPYFALFTNRILTKTISPVEIGLPTKFNLSQNYPNPFNPTTNIKYQIVNNSFVTLKVFDLLGREIRTLVNESLKPGTYETTFDASALSSGIYFYTLSAGEYNETKRMTLLK